MNRNHLSRRRGRILGLLTATALGAAALAVVPAPAQADQNVVVSPQPDQSHPRVLNGRVYALDTYGPLVAVGGTFTSIRNGAGGSPNQDRQWIFLYNSNTGQIVQSFAPELLGPTPVTSGLIVPAPGVEAIEFAPDGQSLYVGGWFTSVNGAAKQRLVRLNLDGSVRSSFNASANQTVRDMALVGNRLIVAGEFNNINGQPVSRLVSLNPTTGATQTDFNLQATVSRDQYAPYVQEIDASADGKWLAVAGNFARIGSVDRNQLGLISLQGTPSVANWSTDLYSGDCASVYDDSWIRSVKISPDSSYLIVSGTGAYRGADSLCDSSARWELPPTQSGDNLSPTWRNLTGGDTFWATDITDSAVYVGGHQRWVNNPRPSPGGDNDGPGSVERAGIVALDPLTGVPLSWNPGRDRGRGAEAITHDDNYVYVGSDTDLFGGQVRQRLAALPVAGGTTNPQPVDVQLPATLNFAVGSELRSASFNGATVGAPSTTPGSAGISWTGFRDGFVQNSKLHYFGASQAFYSRPFSGSSIGDETNLSTTVGYVDVNYNLTPNDQPYGVAETTVAAYRQGQIYYVKSGDGKLYHRGYSLESGIIDGGEFLASGRSFSNARALEFIGDWLYAAWSDGRLYRMYAPGGQVDFDSSTVVDNGLSINWSQVHGLFATQAAGSAVPPTPPSRNCTGGTPWRASYWSNKALTGAPDVTRCEAVLDYNYGNGAPAGTGLGSDNFSGSWTRTVNLPAGGALKVDATADDGVRVYVDGVRIINDFVDTPPRLRTGTSGPLAAGDHTLRVEYYENSDGAEIHVSYAIVDAPPPDPGPDNVAGDTAITTPSANQVLATTSVTTTGTATDDRSVASVRVGVFDRNAATNKWLQANGTWGPNYAFREATLDTPGAASTTWSLGVTLPQGSYAIDAVSVDASGNADKSSAYRPFSISTTPVDNTAPTSAVTSPAKKATVTTSSFVATGTSTDDTGVSQVRVGANNRSTGKWLQANGTWGSAYAFRVATLGTPGGANTTWSLPLSLPNGSYSLDVKAQDVNGNLSSGSVWHPFQVSTVSSDTTAPDSTTTSPAKNAVVGSPVTVTGSSTDNVGVDAVRIAFFNRVDATNKWLQANGTWGPTYAFRLADVASPGAASTTWSYTVPLPSGLYGVDVKAVDTSGNIDQTPPWLPFQVGNDGARPSAKVVSTPGRATGKRAAVVGTAKDDSSVRLVQVKVQRVGTKGKATWLQRNGHWGRTSVFLRADLTKPGARSTRWKLQLHLPKGRYVVRVVPMDGSRNTSSAPVIRRFQVGRG